MLPGPCCFAGGLPAQNPLPSGSPSWGSRIGRAKAFCAQSPAMPPSQLGRSAPKSRRNGDPKRASGSCTLQRETLLQQQTTASPCLGAGNQHKLFLPRPSALHSAKRGWATPGSLGPAALLGVSGGRKHSTRVLLRGQVGLGLRKASAPWPQPSPLSQLGRSALRTRGSDGSNSASGCCILQKETLLGQQTTPPTRIGSGKQCKPFSPQALRSP